MTKRKVVRYWLSQMSAELSPVTTKMRQDGLALDCGALHLHLSKVVYGCTEYVTKPKKRWALTLGVESGALSVHADDP